jgi:hypothetical protein
VEAAAACRDLDASMAEGRRDCWRFGTEGATDEERYCRQVLTHAAVLVEGRPGGDAVVAGLRRVTVADLAGEGE